MARPPVSTPSAVTHAIDSEAPRSRRQQHYHWTLPLALCLAVVYWIYLYEFTTLTKTVLCDIVRHAEQHGSMPLEETLSIGKPNNYTIQSIHGPDHKEIKGKIKFTFKGPRRLLKRLRGLLYVNFPESRIPTQDFGNQSPKWVFRRADVRSYQEELTEFLIDMEPKEITVQLEATGSLQIPLDQSRVQPQYPDESWKKRFFLDTLTFTPHTITLSGPTKTLNKIQADPILFIMDCSQVESQLNMLTNSSTGLPRRPRLSFPVRLRPGFKDLRIGQEITASVQVAPKPTIFPDDKHSYKISVILDHQGFTLDLSKYRVTDKVEVRIKSFNRMLDDTLSRDGEKWVHSKLRGFVTLEEAQDRLARGGEYVALEPNFFCRDQRFRLDRDFEIILDRKVEIKRNPSDTNPTPPTNGK